jgi:EAL domain-containing protein (putative c-di-GMP-specific phosphodiesterase class I)
MLVELGGKVGAKTLAEGIETEEEYSACRDLGIDLIQGYYFAHPQEDVGLGDAEVANAIKSRDAVMAARNAAV